jgi:AraC-like DNA-binding protein
VVSSEAEVLLRDRKGQPRSEHAQAGVSVLILHPLAKSIGRLGGDADSFLERLGISPNSPPDAYVPGSRVNEALDAVAKALRTDCLGLELALASPAGTLGLLDYGVLMSANLREGIARCVRWYRLVSQRYLLTFDSRVSPARLSVVWRAGARSSTLVEFALASLVLRAREALGAVVPLRGVRFRHGGVAGPRHESIFKAPVSFLQEVDELAIDPAVLDLPFRTADPVVVAALEELAEAKSVEGADGGAPVDRARAALVANMSNPTYGMSELAKQLGLSPRSLQRQLRTAGTSHRALLDSVRRETALDLVVRKELSADELAGRLGFVGSRAFYRAFARWTGTTPADYRKSRAQRR